MCVCVFVCVAEKIIGLDRLVLGAKKHIQMLGTDSRCEHPGPHWANKSHPHTKSATQQQQKIRKLNIVQVIVWEWETYARQ